jgi:centrin-1
MKASKPHPISAVEKSGFNANNYIKPGLSEDEIVEIKEVFDLLDRNGGRFIDPRCISPLIQN